MTFTVTVTKHPRFILVDSHHKVLSAWAEYRCTREKPPRLITLDHHTDTSQPFRNFINTTYGPQYLHAESLRDAYLAEIDFRKAPSVHRAVEKLSNDEHIVTAIRSHIISSAFVIAHKARDTDLSTYKEHHIMCRDVLRYGHDLVLESSCLDEVLASFSQFLKAVGEAPLQEEPYILDIDLDYFNTFQSINPEDRRAIQNLAHWAGLISIATEPEYVKACALEPGLSSDVILASLLKILELDHRS